MPEWTSLKIFFWAITRQQVRVLPTRKNVCFTIFAKQEGTRDFSPVEMVKRNYIFDTVKSVFQKYGYLPIETPAMENLSTLLGKYGEEGDKLLFKILNSGDYLKKADADLLSEKASNKVMSQISGNA